MLTVNVTMKSMYTYRNVTMKSMYTYRNVTMKSMYTYRNVTMKSMYTYRNVTMKSLYTYRQQQTFKAPVVNHIQEPTNSKIQQLLHVNHQW